MMSRMCSREDSNVTEVSTAVTLKSARLHTRQHDSLFNMLKEKLCILELCVLGAARLPQC